MMMFQWIEVRTNNPLMISPGLLPLRRHTSLY